MKLSYRVADRADIPALSELGVASYSSHAALLGEASWGRMRANLLRPGLYDELMERATGLVCDAGDALAGMVFFVPSGTASPHFPPEWAHVRMLGIAPQYRGHGISRKLMEACIDAARSRGEQVLGLHTGAFMHAARALYASMGFRVDRKLDPIYDQPYTRFRLDLNGTR